jgi:ankyrin repeat protein
MSKNIDILDRISVPAPCSAGWDSMQGNEQVRFCSHCNLSVHNLSAMTRKEARKIVAASGGKLCVRYYKKPDGAIRTAVASQQLHQIKRRVSRIAAGAFTAALSLSASVAAQTPAQGDSSSSSNKSEMTLFIKYPDAESQGGAAHSLAGVVTDPHGAVIPGASVTLMKEQAVEEQKNAAAQKIDAAQKTGAEQKTLTDSEGNFQFQSLEAGTYSIRVETQGFASQEIKNLLVQPGGEQGPSATVEVQMNVETETAVSGVGMISTPDNPLVKAAFENNLAAMRELLNAGAEVNVVDEAVQTTPLAEAVSQGNLEMVKALLAAGADVNMKNRYGMTALMSLDDESTTELVWTLIAAGAKVNHKDDAGNFALINAAAADKPAVLQALIDAGAKVDAKNHDGQTPLMSAIENGLADNVKVLITAGANLNIRNKEGETALKQARENDQEEIVKLLESYGAIE